MKKFIFAITALSLVTLGLTACRRNRVTLVETSYLVTHPAVHKGDLLTFQIPSATETVPYYVHFDPKVTPCADATIIVTSSEPVHCKVNKEASRPTQYLYYVDTVPQTKAVGKCPPCWPGSIVVGPSSGKGHVVTSKQASGPYPAAEILIYDDKDGNPIANSASVYPEQAVRWFVNGPDKGWTVKFETALCGGESTVTQPVGGEAYCNLTNVNPGTYNYQITVSGTMGPQDQQLVVVSAQASSTTYKAK